MTFANLFQKKKEKKEQRSKVGAIMKVVSSYSLQLTKEKENRMMKL